MTTTTFITGDRSRYAALTAPVIAIEMMRVLNAGGHIATGDDAGTEEIVRAFADEAGINITVVHTNAATLEERAKALHEVADHVVVVHAAPMQSETFLAITAHWDDDDMTLVPTI